MGLFCGKNVAVFNMVFYFRILTTFMCQLQQQMLIMDLPILLAEMVTSVAGTPLDQEYAVSFLTHFGYL